MPQHRYFFTKDCMSYLVILYFRSDKIIHRRWIDYVVNSALQRGVNLPLLDLGFLGLV